MIKETHGDSASYDDTEIQEKILKLNTEDEMLKEAIDNVSPSEYKEGTNITLNNTIEARFKQFEVENGTDVVICNKNLLKIIDGTTTFGGVTISIIDGEITLNGIATEDIWFTVNPELHYGTPPGENCYLFKDADYTFSAYLEGDYSINQSTYIGFNINSSQNTKNVIMNNSLTCSLKETDGLYNCFIRLIPNDTFNNVKVKLQIEEGILATDFVTHKEQNFIVQNEESLAEMQRTAKSYKGTTHIFSTSETSSIFKVEALADTVAITKKEIENAIGNIDSILDHINGEVV